MLGSQTRRRLAQWFPLFRSSQPRAERFGGRPHCGTARSLRIESLERRELLTVTVIEETFKDLAFTATGSITGMSTVNVQGEPLQINLKGKPTATLSGTILYDSRDFGAMQGGALSGQGTWQGGNLKGAWGIGGSGNPIMDEGGQLSGIVVIDQSYVTPEGDGLNGTYNVTDGFFKTSDFSMGMDLTDSDVTLTFKGKLTPTEKKPLDIVITPTWSGNGANVDVEVLGKVHKTADHSTPVTNIAMIWTNEGGTKAKLLPDKMPIYWNQASGQYEITDLPAAPVWATRLFFEAKWTSKDSEPYFSQVSLPLPILSVADASVAEGGPRDKNEAVFTVTLQHTFPLPVTVWFTTSAGKNHFAFINGKKTLLIGGSKPGVDYETTFGSIVIPPGETQGEIKVPIIGDTTYEPYERFQIVLGKPQNARFASFDDGRAFGFINDDDPLPSISINDVSLAEGNLGTTK